MAEDAYADEMSLGVLFRLQGVGGDKDPVIRHVSVARAIAICRHSSLVRPEIVFLPGLFTAWPGVDDEEAVDHAVTIFVEHGEVHVWICRSDHVVGKLHRVAGPGP